MKTIEQLKRSRRLRKKLYVDEYAVLGFKVSFTIKALDETTFDSFFEEFIDFVGSRNLIMGGAGGTEVFTVFISSYQRYGSASEEDRQAFVDWLAERDFIENANVGELTDAYYGA
ncbi:MAG: hypothetical protein ACJAT7_000832 [Psychromonas sp.]|jgi:uncharacterized protein YggL (DUF469 family)|uniref:YggL 50S ribosome-binding family protein n=1 Tax=Psychromonas sp. TaxID=1884585 RepID=UPI0039E33E87